MSSQLLANGGAMPQVGLGVWKIDLAAAAEVVESALQIGYRHLDCASDYGNEKEVGQGIRQVLRAGTCRRDDLWITSKLWNTCHAAEHVKPACERSLADLGLEYLDLYLVHFPISLEYVPFSERYPAGWFRDPDAQSPRMTPAKVPLAETWQAMENLVAEGLVRNIGVCNFNVSLLRDLIAYANIPPAVLQVELHPYLTQEKLLRFCASEGIAVTGFSPLGAGSYQSIGMAGFDESALDEPVVLAAAKRCGKTPAQVVLRWAIQRGTSIVPKSTRVERLRENLDLFDVELNGEEMAAISGLNRNRRFNDPGVFCESAFNTFFPIYE